MASAGVAGGVPKPFSTQYAAASNAIEPTIAQAAARRSAKVVTGSSPVPMIPSGPASVGCVPYAAMKFTAENSCRRLSM